MIKIRTYNHISEKGLEVFSPDRYVVSNEAQDAQAILLRSHNLHDAPLYDKLLCIARAGAGTNNIPVESCTQNGIVVFNTPGANANAVKELVIAGMLLASRSIIEGIQWIRQVEKDGNLAGKVEKEKAKFGGTELKGKTLGVLGLGAIGAQVANSGVTLGMDVLGYDPYISVKNAWGLSRQVVNAQSMQELLEKSDYLTVHVPLVEGTKHMVNDAFLASMKKEAVLINMSRGELVEIDSVKKALDNGSLSKYVTDFPDERIASHERVIPIPHLGASTEEAEENCALMAAQATVDFLEHGNISNSVNFPNAYMSRTAHHRLTVCHRNIPNMVGQVSTLLAGSNINIENMLNRSKDCSAYTMIDYEGLLSDELLRRFSEIDGVLRVRNI